MPIFYLTAMPIDSAIVPIQIAANYVAGLNLWFPISLYQDEKIKNKKGGKKDKKLLGTFSGFIEKNLPVLVSRTTGAYRNDLDSAMLRSKYWSYEEIFFGAQGQWC